MRVFGIALLLYARVAAAQVADLGHRIPGGIGLDAGTQGEQGLYLNDALVWFSSDQVNDRHGNRVPIENLNINAFSEVLGVAGTLKLDTVYLSAAVAVPIVKLSLSADNPQASVDRMGFGDVFVEPIQIGTRSPHVDAVASYSFYVPTNQGRRGGVGNPELSHQLSAGGTIFFDDRRGWRVSALASYLHNQQKRGIDITRGDSIQIQGGAGARVVDLIDVGLVGYALWQVTDDRGPDLPMLLRGARERAFGLGPEIDVTLAPLRSRLTCRFEWDVGSRARPSGRILVVGLTVVAWR